MRSVPATDFGPSLTPWLVSTLGLRAPISVLPFEGGRSNVTLLLTDAGGYRFVLRRPPPGEVLATAHDVVREGRIMRALAPTSVPVPGVHASCLDLDVLGVPFIVMQYVEGTAAGDPPTAATITAEARLECGPLLVDALAALHNVDVASVGLEDMIRPGAFLERQLRRWHKQWESTRIGAVPVVDEVYDRLVAAPPREQRRALTHGDPKLVNCILGPAGEIRALVDWELAAVGDPLADLALLLAYWAEPADELVALQDPPTVVPGFATRRELLDRYAATSELDLSDFDYYRAFAYWKLACIVQGVTWRLTHRAANSASDPAPFARQVHRLAELAYRTLPGTR